MMSIQDQIRTVAAELGFDITPSQVNRMAGTLKFSRLRTASNLDPLIRKEMEWLIEQARQELPTVNTADATTTIPGFQQITDSLNQGNCPRCGKQMRTVKLADDSPVLHCGGECRITLWMPEK